MASVPPLTDIRQLGPRTARTGAFILCRVPAVMRNENAKSPSLDVAQPRLGRRRAHWTSYDQEGPTADQFGTVRLSSL